MDNVKDHDSPDAQIDRVLEVIKQLTLMPIDEQVHLTDIWEVSIEDIMHIVSAALGDRGVIVTAWKRRGADVEA